MDDISKMKVAELKQALKDRSLPTSGAKSELVKRLAEALGASVDTVESSSEPVLEDKIDEDELLNEDSTKPSADSASATDATSTVPAANSAASVSEKSTPEEEPSTIAKPDEVAKLPESERLKMRAEKFGIVSAEAKKQQRAERFGLPTTGGNATSISKIGGGGEIDMDKLKKRAERFGTVISNSLNKVDEDERKRKRAERFGVSNTTDLKSTNISTNVDFDNEAKKKKRAERFGIST